MVQTKAIASSILLIITSGDDKFILISHYSYAGQHP
jgi:hypothetical protein